MSSLFKLLFEEDEKSPNLKIKSQSEPPRLSDDSVDDQIDSYFIAYEERAIKASAETEETEDEIIFESLNNQSLRYLFEQEEEEVPEEEPAEEEDDAGEAAPAEESEVEDPTGSEEMDAESAPEPMKLPSMDVDKFAKSVVRLAKNPQRLLEIEQVIINRAKNYLVDNYNEEYVAKFVETLREQFGYDLEEFEREAASEDVFGVGANPAGAGMSGG